MTMETWALLLAQDNSRLQTAKVTPAQVFSWAVMARQIFGCLIRKAILSGTRRKGLTLRKTACRDRAATRCCRAARSPKLGRQRSPGASSPGPCPARGTPHQTSPRRRRPPRSTHALRRCVPLPPAGPAHQRHRASASRLMSGQSGTTRVSGTAVSGSNRLLLRNCASHPRGTAGRLPLPLPRR